MGPAGSCRRLYYFPHDIGTRLSIDETALSHGELYTIITNKAAKGKKGALVAMIKGTKSDTICQIVCKILQRLRYKCKEITMDFANNMSVIARKCFPAAIQVNDRFHLHQLVHDALQDVRVKYRRQAIDEDNKAMKELGSAYQPTLLENGDTLKQLLVRSRYLLYKTPKRWSESRRERARILFERYPEIKTAYLQAYALNHVFKASTRDVGYSRLARWYEQVEQ